MYFLVSALVVALAASICNSQPLDLTTNPTEDTAQPVVDSQSPNITIHPIQRNGNTVQPVLGGMNFPDPSMIRINQNLFYAFSTNSRYNGVIVNVPMAHSTDFQTWTSNGAQDALPNLPAWVDKSNPMVWAPDVVQLPTGFVMYYTASYAAQPNFHCLGVAISNTITGPYKPTSDQPWLCPTSQGGAIDPSGYTGHDGRRWVVYKIDGNSIGHGGSCNNGIAPIVPTPIMLQQVSSSDGFTKIGNPIQLITNSLADGPVTEAPSLSKMPDGTFVLFFSSNCYTTPGYDVSYATSKNIQGPYIKHGPLFVTGTSGLTAPGGLDIAINGNHAVFHANWGSGRAMFTAIISGGGNSWNAFAPLNGGAQGNKESM